MRLVETPLLNLFDFPVGAGNASIKMQWSAVPSLDT